jgi:hypothetical protein
MARTLWGDHQHVDVRARLDQVEVDVQAVREHQRGAVLHVRREFVAVDVGLQFVRRQHHDDVGPFGRADDVEHLDAFAFGLLDRGRIRTQRRRYILHAAVAHVEQMGMALAAVADHCDLLALDQIEIGVPIVINAHGPGPSLALPPLSCRWKGAAESPAPMADFLVKARPAIKRAL